MIACACACQSHKACNGGNGGEMHREFDSYMLKTAGSCLSNVPSNQCCVLIFPSKTVFKSYIFACGKSSNGQMVDLGMDSGG